ncbi:putative conserved phage C-terminal domain-containing protein [Vibrio phage 137E35-1]|nr:putative conserved phage C-terminal domain-containing protein [Vibrio phage 137E35-1]CAH9016089.1 putative conserved phage C-terminal domain-containing protein [Vibrio phage 230E39-1]
MLQHGAYTQLIDACYDREEFPTLDDAIEWTWASTDEEIQAVKFVLNRFFELEDGVYSQQRIKEEIEKYKKNGEINKRIALEREAKKRRKKAEREEDSTNRDDESTNRDSSVNEVSTLEHERAPNQEPRTKNQEPLTNNKDLLSDKSDAVEVLEHLSKVVGVKFKPTTKSHISAINARLKDGATVEDCKAVIDFKFREWGGTTQAQYLRPGTLFIPKNFNGYLIAAKTAKPQRNVNDIGRDFSAPSNWSN